MRAKAVTSSVIVALLVMGLSATTASAATEVKTVKGEVVFAYGQRPGDPGNCSAIVFVKWPDQPRTVSATAFYTFKGQERSQVAAPPFNDTYEWVATYTVTPGYHWIQAGKSWKDRQAQGGHQAEGATAQRVQREGQEQAAHQADGREGQAGQGAQARGPGLLTASAAQSRGGPRRGRDSNPRTRLTPVTRFPVAPVQPLRHLSRRPKGSR